MSLPVFNYNDVVYDLFMLTLKQFLGRSKKRVSPEYRAWTKARPCHCWNEWNGPRPMTEFHHYGPRGMGQKASDWYGAPLCPACHQYWHQKGLLRTLPGFSHEEAKAFMRRIVAENFLMWRKEKERE